MMPPNPAAISGPNWRSFLTPSTISTPGGTICCMLMPVEPRTQGRKAAVRRAKHADFWVGVEQLAARSLIPFVHPDHGQRPIGAGGGFDDGRRPRTAG